ncbi:hypothetical protein HN415_02115 [Candidatus Woesearchaeota archaeon]|nr:hypothetical protein [Candidatus Woesearchaeota archaeon]
MKFYKHFIKKSINQLYKSKGKNTRIFFDTCAILKLYNHYGSDILKSNKPHNMPEYIITNQVLEELENQKLSRRKNDKGRLLCPYELMNAVYSRIGEESLLVLPTFVKPEQLNQMKSVADELSNNKRISEADASLIIATRDVFEKGKNQFIISSDSDLLTLMYEQKKNRNIITAGIITPELYRLTSEANGFY